MARADYWVESVLPNGLRILIHPLRAARTTTWGVFVNHGVKDETVENNGISHFLEHVLFSAQYRRSTEIARLIDRGSVAEAFTTKEYTRFSITTIPEDAMAALDGLATLLTEPVFDLAFVEKERGIIIEELRRFQGSALFVDELLENALFGDRSLGLYTMGSLENVQRFTPDQLHERYKKYYVPVRTVVVGEGPLDGEAAIDLVHRALGDWNPPSTAMPPPIFEDRPKIVGIPSQGSRVVLRMGFRGPGLLTPDRAVFTLLADALGLGIGSRLWNALRSEEALVYDMQALPISYGPAGYLKIEMSFQRDQAAEILPRVLDEVSRLHDGLGEQELSRCCMLRSTGLLRQADDPRRMLPIVGRFAINGQMFLVDSEIHHYRLVTREATARVARQYLTGDTLALVALGLSTDQLFTMVA